MFLSALGRVSSALILVLLFAGLACERTAGPRVSAQVRTGAFYAVFGGPNRVPERISSHVASNLDPSHERFFLYVPSSYTGTESYGMIVFTYADPEARLPYGWQQVLDSRKYIFVAAQNAGNDQPRGRRLGLAVMGALKTMKAYNIDRNRVYASGFSGGARMAGLLAFYQSDIFHGTIQNCGADFYRQVPTVNAVSQVDTAGQAYGVLEASQDEIQRAKTLRFVLITGTNDFRRGNILDIFHGGFERDGFHAKLFDMAGMGHDICDSETLTHALDFLESGS